MGQKQDKWLKESAYSQTLPNDVLLYIWEFVETDRFGADEDTFYSLRQCFRINNTTQYEMAKDIVFRTKKTIHKKVPHFITKLNVINDYGTVNDLILVHFRYVKVLNLSSCPSIYGGGFRFLWKVEELDLAFNKNFFCRSLRHLTSIKKLNLGWCVQMTDEGLSYVANVPNLSIRNCYKVTNEGLKHLSNVQILDISEIRNITDDGLSYLKNLKELKFYRCENITDVGLSHLKGLHSITLYNNKLITDAGIQQLTELRTLRLMDLDQLTNNCLKGLIHLKELHLECNQFGNWILQYCQHIEILRLDKMGVTNDEMIELKNVKELELFRCHKLRIDGLKHLKNLKKLTVTKCDGIEGSETEILKLLKEYHRKEAFKLKELLEYIKGLQRLDLRK